MSLSPYPTLIMWVLKSVIIFFPMGAIIQIIVAVIVFQKGHKPAIYFLISYLTFIVGTFIHSAIVTGILPYIEYMSHILVTNFVIFTMAITISLTERIAAIHKEKARSKQLEIDKQNLEFQVSLRTEALSKSEEKYRELVNDLYDWVWQMEFGGIISFCSKGVFHILGYTPNEMINRKFDDFFPKEEVDKIRNIVLSLSNNIDNMRFQSYCYHKSGRKVFIESSFRIVRNQEGKIITYSGVTRDITQQKNVDLTVLNTIIETENKERARISADLHDGLGATLTGLNLYMNSLKDEKTSIELKKDIAEKSHIVVKHVAEEIRRISHNLKPYELDKYSLITCIENLCDKIVDSGKIKIIFDYSLYRNNLLKEYDLILFRIISELLNNTMKHSGANKIEISMLSDKNLVKIKYKDNGKGFNINAKENNDIDQNGLDNIRMRLYTISAKINFYSKENEGFKAIIIFVI